MPAIFTHGSPKRALPHLIPAAIIKTNIEKLLNSRSRTSKAASRQPNCLTLAGGMAPEDGATVPVI
jgi:hypothetical protein